MLLADLFYRAAHHHTTGQAFAHPSAISTGCAAALLAELLVSRHIDIGEGTLVPVYNPKPPANAVTHAILDTITGEPQEHPLKDWLQFLARTSTSQVATRIVRKGEATEHIVRRMVVQRHTVLIPADPHRWEGIRAYLYTYLSTGRMPSWDMAWLTGLVSGAGLHDHLLDGAPESAREHLAWIIGQLPEQVRHLIDATATATGEAVTSRR